MTTVVVPVDPPFAGHALTPLVPAVLSPDEAVTLYRSMVADVCGTVQHGSADLLVNYREAEDAETDVAATTRDFLAGELPDPDAARYEPQVGETLAGRLGNALTHLLESEGEGTVGFVDPTACLLRREHLGSLMMKLRTNEMVVGPAPGGRVYGAAFSSTIDYADALAMPAVETLTGRGTAAGLDVDFLPLLPVVETPADLASVLSLVRARDDAGLNVPARTVATVEALDLAVDTTGSVSREGSDS